jgi:D-arabinose 1-dehydrogenase-like Zn-dependent alcohol dehydrogenase
MFGRRSATKSAPETRNSRALSTVIPPPAMKLIWENGLSANVPEPKADDVVVKVRRAGICGSDVHILHGSNPFAVYPRVIGHEFAGEVLSLGAGVTGMRVGDRVVVDPVLSCGNCYPWRKSSGDGCSSRRRFPRLCGRPGQRNHQRSGRYALQPTLAERIAIQIVSGIKGGRIRLRSNGSRLALVASPYGTL